MNSILFYFICLTILLGSLDARWIYRDDQIIDPLEDNLSPKQRSKLWVYFQNRREQNDVETSNSDENIPILPKRSYLVYADRQSPINQRNRPNYTYGRKSHWDTFFG